MYIWIFLRYRNNHNFMLKWRFSLKVTDDIVNSEAKLQALFLRWLKYNEHHFDVEDGKAFKERFETFKDRARFVNQHNKTSSSFICGLTTCRMRPIRRHVVNPPRR
ncbi:hypothetical protein MKX01_034214 [Papaver californicum]|nr:hypothetical protein MKX01_034214 [Papaver californicum]